MEEIDATFRDWSGLPDDLLTSIGELLGLPGRLCFRGVCRSWSAALPAMPSPWLVIPDGLCLVQRERFTVHSLTTRTSFRWTLPGERCIGSSGGWLAFVDANLRITLLNPLADDAAAVRLPPLGPFRREIDTYFSPVTPLSPEDGTLRLRTWREKNSNSHFQQSFVKRVAFAPNPTAQDYAVAVLCRGDRGMAFASAGSGGRWRWLHDWPVAAGRAYPEHVDRDIGDDDTELFYVNHDLDVVYHAGRFYYMTLCGQAWSMDAGSSSSPSVAAPVKFAKWRPPGPDYRHYVKHLVFAGVDGPAPAQLHVVWSDMPGFTCDAMRARPMRMRVQRYDPAARRWRKARRLGGSAFLIGQRSQSVAVPVPASSTATWLRPNCVYFTTITPGNDNLTTRPIGEYPEELGQIWEFDVEAGSFRQCDRGGLQLCWFNWLDWPKAIWFTPRVESNGRSAHEMAPLSEQTSKY